MGFIDKIIDITRDNDLRYFLEEWYAKDQTREIIREFLRSKVNQDGFSRELSPFIERTSTIPTLDDPPEIPSNPKGEPVTVRRYFSIPKFNSLLRSGIWFSRLDKFSDDYEGRVSDKTVRARYDKWEYLEFEDDPPPFDLRDMDDAKDEIVRKQSFVSCWRYGGEESAVFWDAYIDGHDGVAIETNLDNLQSILEDTDRDVLLGKVNYKRYKGSTEQFAADVIDRIFHKRHAFGDEQELRLLARKQIQGFNVNYKGGKKFEVDIEAEPGFNLQVDPNELIEKIILPPGVSERHISQVIHLLDYHGVEAEVWRSILDVNHKTTAPQKVTGEDAGKITREDMKGVRIVDQSKYVR